MRNIALFTAYPYWNGQNGACTRIRALAGYLAERARLTVVYMGRAAGIEIDHPHRGRLAAFWHFPRSSHAQRREAIRKSIAERLSATPPELAIFEYLHVTWANPGFPATTTVVDAMDIVSRRNAAARALGYEPDGSLSEEEEFANLSRFDYIAFIQDEDRDYGAAKLPRGRCLLVPHAVEIANVDRAPGPPCAGMVASNARHNIVALEWLDGKVAPLLKSQERIMICGPICGLPLAPFKFPRLRMRGRADDLRNFYREIDVALVPLPYGSGLKIKAVEAMGYGRPVIATHAGAQGLRDAVGRGLVVADTPEDYAAALNRLLGDEEERKRLGALAQAYAAEHFTPDSCFRPLLDLPLRG